MSSPWTGSAERLQEQILKIAAQQFPRNPLSAPTVAAFRAVPRHWFVRRFLDGEHTIEVTAESLAEHLPAIYHNGVINLWADTKRGVYSAISQPTLVLRMLDLLRLAEGHRVFELGAGSGWNAALLGHLVGQSGRVSSVEIIPEIARTAQQLVAEHRIANVEIVAGDGGAGYPAGAPYDRAVFTAGSYDVPRAFHEQVRVGGLLLIVIKVEGGGDQLFLLEKHADYFEAVDAMVCAFVPMTGAHALTSADPVTLASLPEWGDLQSREVARVPFWWGSDGRNLHWQTIGLRSFLSVTEPRFQVFKAEHGDAGDPEHWFFGLRDVDARSLVVARDRALVSYGSTVARDGLLARLHDWVDRGMPTLSAMNLRVFPANHDRRGSPGQWIVRRRDSQFVWSLKENHPPDRGDPRAASQT